MDPHIPLSLLRRGKVRDVYDVGDSELLLMVASDRVSAFDVVLPAEIPGKGAILNQISTWWLERTRDIVPNHLVTADPEEIVDRVPGLSDSRGRWAWRSMLVRRLDPLPVECVVRGYLAGSAWAEYRRSGTLAGEPLPAGLEEAAALEPPVFSPATKAETGHDENITRDRLAGIVGDGIAARLEEASRALYARGREVAARSGLLLADTKFEFAAGEEGEVILIDELLTPDSSRYWPEDGYQPGSTPPALDKQPLRDYLEGLVGEGRWDRTPPGPELPQEVCTALRERYLDLFRRITGSEAVLS